MITTKYITVMKIIHACIKIIANNLLHMDKARPICSNQLVMYDHVSDKGDAK